MEWEEKFSDIFLKRQQTRRWPCSHICIYIYISVLCPSSESHTYKLSFFLLNVRNRKQYSCAYELRVGTASGIYFSSWYASGKSTTPLQLPMNLQIHGGLDVGWMTTSGRSGSPTASKWDPLSFRAQQGGLYWGPSSPTIIWPGKAEFLFSLLSLFFQHPT